METIPEEEQFDETLECESKSEPIKNRTATDVIWLISFLSLTLAWLCLGVYVGASSKTISFLSTYSSYKDECHSRDKKYLLYFGLADYFKNTVISSLTDIFIQSQFCHSGKVCVTECPTTIWTADLFLNHILPFNHSLIQDNLICINDEIKKNITTLDLLENIVSKNLCAREYSYNIPVLNLCLPYELLINLSATKFKWNVAINVAELIYLCVLQNVWYVIMVFISSCVLLKIYICLLPWIAIPLLWFSITGFILFATIGFIYSFMNYFGIEFNVFFKFYNIWVIKGGSLLSLISVILVAVLLLVIIKKVVDIIHLKDYMKPGLILIRESYKTVFQTKGSLFFIFLVICIYLALAIWAWNIMVCLMNGTNQDYTIKNKNNLSCNCSGEYQNVTEGNKCLPETFSQFCSNCICSKFCEVKFYFLIVFHIFNIFAVVWSSIFIFAFFKMVLAYSLYRCHYNVEKKGLRPFDITSSTKTILRFHLGTAACGSFGILLSAVYKIIVVLRIYPTLISLLCPIKINVSAAIHKYSFIIVAVNGTDFKHSIVKLSSSIIENEEQQRLHQAIQTMLNVLKWTICLVLIIILFLIPHKKSYCLEITLYFLCICIYLISTIYIQVCKILAGTLMYCYIQDQNSKNKGKKLIPEGLKSFFEKQGNCSCKNHQDKTKLKIWAFTVN